MNYSELRTSGSRTSFVGALSSILHALLLRPPAPRRDVRHTHDTDFERDFESFTNALGALPNQPPVPMACEPSPSPIDVDTKAIVQQVVNVLVLLAGAQAHSPSPAVHLEVLGRRWLALVSNLTYPPPRSVSGGPAGFLSIPKRKRIRRAPVHWSGGGPQAFLSTKFLFSSLSSGHAMFRGNLHALSNETPFLFFSPRGSRTARNERTTRA